MIYMIWGIQSKGTVRTKYGTKAQLKSAIDALHKKTSMYTVM